MSETQLVVKLGYVHATNLLRNNNFGDIDCFIIAIYWLAVCKVPRYWSPFEWIYLFCFLCYLCPFHVKIFASMLHLERLLLKIFFFVQRLFLWGMFFVKV